MLNASFCFLWLVSFINFVFHTVNKEKGQFELWDVKTTITNGLNYIPRCSSPHGNNVF